MNVAPKSFCKDNGAGSEFAFKIQLKATAWVGRGRSTEIRIARPTIGTDHANIRDIVRVIEDVEDVKGSGEHRPVFFLFFKMKIVGHVHVQIHKPRPVQ